MNSAYKNVYKMENGVLIKNTQNKIEYLDENKQKRTKTNPTYEDFYKVGMYPKREENIPGFNPSSEELKQVIVLRDRVWEVGYEVLKKEVAGQ